MMTISETAFAERMQRLASDLWWSWNPAARDLFRRLDYTLWRQTDHNPIKILKCLPHKKLEEAAQDPQFMEAFERVMEQLNRAQSGTGKWWRERYPAFSDISIAYFSAEFGIHQSIPL